MSGFEALAAPALIGGASFFTQKYLADKQTSAMRNAAPITPTPPPPLPVTGDAASEEARRRARLENDQRAQRGRAGTILSEGAVPAKTYENTVLG